jgi:5-aminolevulinate synthase
MGRHPLVVEAVASSARRHGTGGGGTRNIAGNSHAVVELEAEIADLHRKSAALVFSSGYIANEASLGTLGSVLPDCVIFSDEKNHASMISGICGSRAEKRIFRHNDVNIWNPCFGRPRRTAPGSSHSNRCIRWMATSRHWRAFAISPTSSTH